MKYIKKIIFLVIMIVALNIQSSYAAKGTVTTDGVRVRKSPSTSAEIVTVLNKSAIVEIVEESGDWYKIKYTWNGNYEGYMSKQFIKKEGSEEIPVQTPTPTVAPTIEPTPVPTPTPEIQETPTVAPTEIPAVDEPTAQEQPKLTLGDKVTNITTKIYILPTITATIKENVEKNTIVTVQEIAGNFAYIKYSNKYGWVRTSTLQEIEQQVVPDNAPESVTVSNEKKGYVNVTQAIVRQNATTSSNMITALNFNSEVIIIGEESDFYKIKINGIEAYIAKRLISDTKQQTTNRSVVERQDTALIDNTVIAEPTSETVPNSAVGEQIAEMAKSYLGYKYVYGGASPSTGFDCSGLVYYICGQLGYSINRTADAQVNNGVPVEKSNLQPGDLVFFSNYKTYQGIGHVGIYIGNNQFVHASTATTGVITSSLNQADYVKRYVTARRIGA